MFSPRAASLLAVTPYSARREAMPDRAIPSTTSATTTSASVITSQSLVGLLRVPRAHRVQSQTQDQDQKKIEPDEELPVLGGRPPGDQDGHEQTEEDREEQAG